MGLPMEEPAAAMGFPLAKPAAGTGLSVGVSIVVETLDMIVVLGCPSWSMLCVFLCFVLRGRLDRFELQYSRVSSFNTLECD